ncbi:hypothetical protein QFC22_004439 [Naganishia vaughanmartiniae]|uniref:Uncharacterized protein n=1 Tax=Naganishia vaughanmartiniae TaxID=1424756 RepID=A0ACC2X2F7_9TREE|nr:hypothetical protein QFC22_004439 [Naganishia vaughanmartiniae]
MTIALTTYIEVLLCFFAIVLFRPSLLSKVIGNDTITSEGSHHIPSPLKINRGNNGDSPLQSALIPFITVSPASGALVSEPFSAVEKAKGGDSQTVANGDETRHTMVSFAPSALVVESSEPPSATSSDTLPASPKAKKTPIRRGSGHIKISSIPAQDGENTKHTLKGRPLTPFVKYDALAMEEPLTAQVFSGFDVMNGLPSPFERTSNEGGANGLNVTVDIESVVFDDAGVHEKRTRTGMKA